MKKIISAILAAALMLILFPAGRASAATPKLMPAGEAAYTNVIDVSHHETVSSWAALRQNTSIIYIKATEGIGYTDSAMDSWATGAAENRIDFGFYHYFWPRVSDAVTQAGQFVQAISKYPYTCIPAIDVEESSAYSGGPALSSAEITQAVNLFRAEVTRLTGLPCMIYVGPYFARDHLTSAVSDAPLWLADYRYGRNSFPGAEAPQWAAWTMWQYTDSTAWPGISGVVDADKATSAVLISGKPTAGTPAQSSTAVTQAPFTGDRAVQKIQQKLNAIQIPRPALDEDGYTGPKTREGVRVMEQVCGLTADSGVWGGQCQSAYDKITARPTLKSGSTGTAVRYLQYRLGIQFDGQFGAQTERAVKTFQTAHHLKADGIVGQATWAALMEA